MSSTVSPASLFPQLRTPWLISSTTTWPSTVVQTWPGWITIWVGVAGSSAMVQWSLPTQTTTSPASSRVGSSPSGHTHRWPRTTAVTDSGASSSSRTDQGCVEQDPQQEGAAGAWSVEESGESVHASQCRR